MCERARVGVCQRHGVWLRSDPRPLESMLNSALCSRVNKCGRVDSSSFLKDRLSLARHTRSLKSGVGDQSGPGSSSVSPVMMRGHQSAGRLSQKKGFFFFCWPGRASRLDIFLPYLCCLTLYILRNVYLCVKEEIYPGINSFKKHIKIENNYCEL